MSYEATLSLRQFVFRYIVPLFLAALILVLIAYFNELRSQETTQQLQILNEALEERDERMNALESRVAVLEAAQTTAAQ